MNIRKRILLLFMLLAAHGSQRVAFGITVGNAADLRRELDRAQPGAVITLASGAYGHGLWIENLSGTKANPIVIAGEDKQNPPRFTGGNEAIHFSDCSYITLRNIWVSGCAGNGVNADDGGSFETPSVGMVFENVKIENIGPKGNFDGLKLSGLVDFTVRNCTFAGWGGSAIDMVGCRDGVIENSAFMGKEGYSQATGIQAKGGSERVLIQRNTFTNAGERAVNLGGSTGLPFFRPAIRDYEAKDIIVAENHFVGSTAPIAYVTSINCQVRHNTLVNPEKWVLRILQEQPTNQFQSCRAGVFEDNRIEYDNRVRVFMNVGPDTSPETFLFRRNAYIKR